MDIRYLGGKTNCQKWVHIFYHSEYAHNPLMGWLPKDNKIDEWLDLEDGLYYTPAMYGNYIVQVYSRV